MFFQNIVYCFFYAQQLFNGEDFWIGANDIYIEGGWVWESDKSMLLFSDWHGGELNNYNNKDFGSLE
jgi:hypothetical protein